MNLRTFSNVAAHAFSGALIVFVSLWPALAQDATTTTQTPSLILRDVNQNGVISIAAFGDSITRGVGDFYSPTTEIPDHPGHPAGEAGYPLRIEEYVHVSVLNYGLPGEEVAVDGLFRFAAKIPGSGVDFVIISGGTNDILNGVPAEQYHNSIQAMINIARASGIEPILAANPPTSGDHSWYNGPINSYNQHLRGLATSNEIPYADVHKAFTNTCDLNNCNLLIRGEGLHPDEYGYDVMGEEIIATLYQIDLFAQDGATVYEQTLGLPAGSVRTEPDPVQTTTAS